MQLTNGGVHIIEDAIHCFGFYKVNTKSQIALQDARVHKTLIFFHIIWTQLGKIKMRQTYMDNLIKHKSFIKVDKSFSYAYFCLHFCPHILLFFFLGCASSSGKFPDWSFRFYIYSWPLPEQVSLYLWFSLILFSVTDLLIKVNILMNRKFHKVY